MVSGVELTLTFLPLAISAAESQRDFFGKSKILMRQTANTGQQLDFFHELCDELALLANSLRSLICSLPSATEKDLTLATDPKQWASGIRDDEIDAEFGPNAEAFKSIITRLNKSLVDLVSDKSLALGSYDVRSIDPMFAKLTAFRQGMENGQTAGDWKECLRFTKNERTRTVALHKIHGANKNLERLLRGSGMLIKSEQQPPPKRSTPPTRTRRFSSALYDTMAGKWPNTCECHRRHEARLCLWNCCSSQRLSESDDSLDMLVSIKDRDQGLASWQESTLLVSSERDPRNAQRAIRFVVDGKAVPIPSTENNPGRDIDSESLCKLIKESHHRGNSLRLIYKYGKLWQARSRRKSLRIQKQIDVPLKILLPTRGMRLKDQRILAVVLAHAALHCSDGPWLCKDWSKEHITFFRHDATGIDLSRPCLAVNFTDPPFFTGDDPNPFNPHAYPSLLSLGILLLEIYLCQPIESRWSELDLIDGQPNENTNLTTAMRLLEDSEGDLYEDYRNAIKACLNCDRIWANDDSPDPEEFRRQVYEDIVYPLEQELERGFHVKPEDLHLDRESDDESPKN